MSAQAVVVWPVYLVKGDDPSLVAQEARSLIDALVGDGDPGLIIEEFGGPGTEGIDVGAVIDACTTPAFLVERRVVVVREAGRLVAADAARLVEYLADPLPSSALVLVAGGGTVPQALVKAVGASGEVRDTSVGTGRARTQWLADHLHDAPVKLDAAAGKRLGEHLGEDMGRLKGILETLEAAYGTGARVGVDELEPFLGEAGGVPSWDLTDAVAAGDTAGALSVLTRMLESGSQPLQLMAVLHRQFAQALALDGAEVRTADEAAGLLGLKSAFPAKKAMELSRRLGSEGAFRAIELLAAADLDLRGTTGLDATAVMEILVARLSRLAPPAHARGGRGR